MHVESLSRAFVIHNPRTKPGRENASFRVYPGSFTASTNASVSVRLRWLHGARSRNERVLLFNPLKLFRIMALTPGTPRRENFALNVSALISMPLCCVPQKSSISCLRGASFRCSYRVRERDCVFAFASFRMRIISMRGSVRRVIGFPDLNMAAANDADEWEKSRVQFY